MKKKIDLFNQVQGIKNIFDEIKSNVTLKTGEEQENFSKLYEKLTIWSDRLKDTRFKVALVGTTSAGKSSFANALLHKDLLPEDDKTTTYTSASIESSDVDKAIIEFYSKDEFKTKFNELLKEIKIDNQNYGTLTIGHFEYLFNDLENWQKDHVNTQEIRNILEQKKEIEEYLGSKTIELSEISKESLKGYITKPEIARAVKRITIKSTQFKDMDNLIIYDVPGFDSPTKLHKEQALKFMKDAEIVILVHGFGNNSDLNDSQVRMLTSTKDEFGQELAKKMIVVGNKIDKEIGENEEEAKDKIRKLSKDLTDSLKKFNVYHNKNFIPISAKGYLQEENIVFGEEITNKLKRLNISNGFSEFNTRLKEIFEHDALEVLNTVVNKISHESKAFLQEFKLNYNPIIDAKRKRTDEFALVDKKWKEIQKLLREELFEQKNIIKENKYDLDTSIKNQVNENWISKISEKVDDYVKNEIIKGTDGRNNNISASKINDRVREVIYKESLKLIIKISTDTIEENSGTEEKELFEILRKNILNKNENLERNLKNILFEITNDYKYETNSYKPLIHRFLNNIFEVIILHRINDKLEGRGKSFNDNRANIEGLLYITETDDDTKSLFEQDLIQKILIQSENIKLSNSNNPLSELLNQAKVSVEITEVKDEIVKDLENLKEIFNDIILKAIQIETPFKDSLQDQIQAILNDIDSDNINKSKLRSFIIENIDEIFKEEYRKLEIDEEMKNILNNIIKKIDDIEETR